MPKPIYRVAVAGKGSDGYYKYRSTPTDQGILDELADAGGKIHQFCRCLEEQWGMLALEEWPDVDSVANYMGKLDAIKVEHTMSWECVAAMGYASYNEGRCEMIEAPLYRCVFLKPFSRINMSSGVEEILYKEISESLEKNGGQIVVGCSPVEEQWNWFAFEAWQSFDGIIDHVAMGRELQAKYGLVWEGETYIGVPWS